MNTFENTFKKHVSLLNERLNLREGADPKKIKLAIDQYKGERARMWKSVTRDDYESMIDHGKIPDQFSDYYPNWTIDDIKTVYRGVEGKDYTPNSQSRYSSEPTDAGPSNEPDKNAVKDIVQKGTEEIVIPGQYGEGDRIIKIRNDSIGKMRVTTIEDADGGYILGISIGK